MLWALAALLLQLEFKMLFPAEILCCCVHQMVETAVGLGTPIWKMGCSIHVHGSVSISSASLWSECCWEPVPLVGLTVPLWLPVLPQSSLAQRWGRLLVCCGVPRHSGAVQWANCPSEPVSASSWILSWLLCKHFGVWGLDQVGCVSGSAEGVQGGPQCV